jgi:hypothetical protein
VHKAHIYGGDKVFFGFGSKNKGNKAKLSFKPAKKEKVYYIADFLTDGMVGIVFDRALTLDEANKEIKELKEGALPMCCFRYLPEGKLDCWGNDAFEQNWGEYAKLIPDYSEFQEKLRAFNERKG